MVFLIFLILFMVFGGVILFPNGQLIGYGTTPDGCRGGNRYVKVGFNKIDGKGHKLTDKAIN